MRAHETEGGGVRRACERSGPARACGDWARYFIERRMRMWMVNPRILCRKHLLGEHLEIHMLCSSLLNERSITGFLTKKLVEPTAIVRRHKELVEEMIRRGYRHASPLSPPGDLRKFAKFRVDRIASLKELVHRCKVCSSMLEKREVEKRAYEIAKTKRYRKAHPELVNSRNVAWLKMQREKAAGSVTPDRCTVCHKVGKIHFDHDAKSGAFRGWLCQHCNWTIGHAKDSPKLLHALAHYLENFERLSTSEKRARVARTSTKAWQSRTK